MMTDKVKRRIMAFLIFILGMLLIAAMSFIFKKELARLFFGGP